MPSVKQIQPRPGFLLIKVENSLLPQCHVCLQAAMLPAMMTVDETSETVSWAQFNISLCKSCCGHSVSSQQLKS